jgi:trehalose 6-phosphate synthase/phosphatase
MSLLVVSNRLPVTVTEREGQIKFQKSAGGLVSGLSVYLDSLKSSSIVEKKYLWVGWPGVPVAENKKKEVKEKLLSEVSSYPVFISEKAMDNFYHGFCNKTIWPLFHYFPSYTIYDEEYWETYIKMNHNFHDAVLEVAKPGDIIWIHDYHLMLLPKMLREKLKNPIGFFLHIPFPSFEMFRLLPGKWRTQILQGLLGAHLVGFHTHDYTQYFLKCVHRILGYEHNMGKIIVGDHIVKADAFPMGIDYKKYHGAVSTREVQRHKKELKKTLSGYKVILSIDRLDYTKGILNRLKAYSDFLERNQRWHGKVVMVMVVVPSRIGVEQYQDMKKQIDALAGNINGKFGTLSWAPILYQYKSLPFNPLVALYSISDVALITPLRDGMNLVAKEYVAAQEDQTGVLILSEMTGASHEMAEAVIINPNNIEEIVEALETAMEMLPEEQVKRNKILQKRLQYYDVSKWAESFIHELTALREEQNRFNKKILGPGPRKQLLQDYIKAKKRLVFLDYDGTLIPFSENPQEARPGKDLLGMLENLAADKKTQIVLTSGRDKETLQDWFGSLDIGLIAEHGIWFKEKNKDWRIIKPLSSEWKEQILPVLETYADRLPGSFVEEKDYSVVWHYRRADAGTGSIIAKELVDYLVDFTANIDIQVMQGHKIIEVTDVDVNKSSAGIHWLASYNSDFIMAIGDDWTDEYLFKVLPERAYSIRVGITQSHARFNLRDSGEVISLLGRLIKSARSA